MNSYISIKFNNLSNEKLIYIDMDNLYIFCDGINYSITKEQINYLLKLMQYWKEEYYSNALDAEEYEVNVYINNNMTKYFGKGTFPENYSNFKSFIGKMLCMKVS